MKIYDTLVIGAGQAGLAAGYHMQQQGLDFAILEAADEAGGSWPSYYDSLTLFSPAAYSSLPGFSFPGSPDRYPQRDEVTAYLRTYARHFGLPVIGGVRVVRIARESDFEIEAADGRRFQARSIIVATGGFNTPHVPVLAKADQFRGRQMHAGQYRRPKGFEGQRVIVVGAGNSAVQIAVELAKVAQVTLAVREPIRFQRQRIFGLDIHAWFRYTGLDRLNWIRDQSTPVLDTGRYQAAIAEKRPDVRSMFDRFSEDGVIWSGGMEEHVDTVLYATGYCPNVTFLEALGAVQHDRPLHRKGTSTTVPGLYFVGLPHQRNLASATLRGVGADSRYVVRRLADGLRASVLQTYAKALGQRNQALSSD